MKKILVTGGCGFIGSHLTEFFLLKNLKVIVLDKKGARFSPNWLKNNKHKNLEIILDDVENKKKVFRLVQKVDYVIHLAALISIPHSYKFPEKHIDTNIIGTFNILEAARKYKKKCIITSTSETYGSGIKFPMKEDHRLLAQSPYAATKISADQLALSYHSSFDVKLKIIRPFNCYGPRQSPRAIIPNIIIQILLGQKKINVGNLETFRDFTHVKDLCRAYWALYKSNRGFGEIYNVGSHDSLKISTIYKKIVKITGFRGKLNIEKKRLRPKKSEVTKLYASNLKIKKDISWRPLYNFEKGLKENINWYKENLSFFKSAKNRYFI